MAMENVSIKEFKNNLTKLIREKGTLVIQRHGKSVGLYVPLEDVEKLPVDIKLQIFSEAVGLIRKQMKKKGITEKQVLKDFERYKRTGGRL